MAEIRWRARLYLRLIGARVRAQLQYRLSFALDLLGAFFISFIDFLAIVFLFSHLPRLAGWSLQEVAFFYGTANMAFAFCDLAVGHLDMFPQMIRDGSFDLILIRPAGSLFQVISSDLAMRRIGRVLQGLAVLAFALSRLHVAWTAGRLAMLVGMIVTGTTIYAAVWIMGAS
ncbi:MAG: ABC-2 family transporter protein, partial [Chloroflexi bacterium]|nr:ABC-2 family transporter protein [Chloroflexota bacterium]